MSGFEGKNVLVTGAGGFIGSHLTEALVREGANVKALVRYNSLGTAQWLEGSPILPEIEIVRGDICDQDLVMSAMEGVETAFHLAALIGIPYSYEAPRSYVSTNVVGTLNVLQAGRSSGVGCVVNVSTSEVYGSARYVPIDEAHPVQGQSPYSASKIGAEKLAESYHCSFGLPIVNVRPFNTYGPRQSTRAVVPTIITQCLAGDTVKLGSLHPTRDLSFVSDTVGGFLRAAQTPAALGKTVNLGTGHEISIGDLVVLISELVGREVRVETDSQRLRPEGSEVDRLLVDNSLARKLLDWEPSVVLADGLAKTIAWLRENRNRFDATSYAR